MEEVCGETEIEEIGRKESVGEDVMAEEGKGEERLAMISKVGRDIADS